jgi:DNA (cytosine-5)-methyltransferase 1
LNGQDAYTGRIIPAAYGFQTRIARNGRGDGGDLVGALSAQAGETGKGDSAPCVAIAFDSRQECVSSLDTFGALGASHPQAQAVAFHENQRGEVVENDTVAALSLGGGKPGQGYAATRQGMAVRRLTPRECERLQGFPDDYTQNRVDGKPAKDGPRYRALGNAIAVPCLEWIGKRIELVREVAP